MFARALFVGINKYNSPGNDIPELQGCVGDMDLMKATMLGIHNLMPQDIEILTDQKATFNNIIDSLERLVKNVKSGQQVFMYYAGHGGQVPNIIPAREDFEAYDQMLVPHDFSKEKPLLDDILHSYLNQVGAGAKFTLILDSCHSGGMARMADSNIDMKAYAREGWQCRSIGTISRAEYSPKELQALAEHKKRYMREAMEGSFILLAAAQHDESSWEKLFGETKHGIFTYHICEGLKTLGPDASAAKLIDYAYSKFAGYRERQMPRLSGNEYFFNRPVFSL